MIDSLHGPLLSDFAHRASAERRDPAGRVAALLATMLLYGALLFLAFQGFAWVAPQAMLQAPRDAVVHLLPASPQPHLKLQDFTVHLIRPRAENAPMPEIVIAPAPSNAPRATLAATAARDTALAGGAANGAAAGSVNGVGTGGNGKGMAACMDPAYLEQIMRHVARFYHYPITGRSGVAYVHFVIDASGHYKELLLLRGTGDILLDGAAMQTMRLAQPLPPIPARFHTDRLDGVLPIVYQHGGQKLVPQQLGSAAGGC
jgi:protein TonB